VSAINTSSPEFSDHVFKKLAFCRVAMQYNRYRVKKTSVNARMINTFELNWSDQGGVAG
jgi:hypothetical protein